MTDTPQLADEAPQADDVHAACQQQFAAIEAKWKRAIADYQNRERDIAREREEFAKYVAADVIRDFLPLMDAIVAAQSLPALHQLGLEILKRNGVTPTGLVGERVDYLQHEVVATKAESGKAAGEIVEVVQVGYVMNGRVLRVAKVIIAA
ncbi:nucleotide exchange factor GrpE [Candidatus Uhrbacteria bacterium]|nr:nucleotide exchange factor GrpE [Candidatus Uhrbacteria bacterium]